MPDFRPTRAEIDLDAARRNLGRLRHVIGGEVGIWAVIKADAYGHGAEAFAAAVAGEPAVVGVAVSLVEEGTRLRDAGHRGAVLVLGATPPGAHAEVLGRGLTPVISDLADVEAYDAAARARGTRVQVHVKIDTGMSRLGVMAADAAHFAKACLAATNLTVVSLCTHLACADSPGQAGDDATALQVSRFESARTAFAAVGLAPPMLHLANSAGAVRFPAARGSTVRPGILLYGGGPDVRALGLEPVMRLCSEIVQLRSLPVGEAVSYGWRARVTAPTVVATVPIGYADGYPRRANLAENGMPARALVAGRRVPVLGTVCMDMVMLDVTALGADAALGAQVVLLGTQGAETITIGELAGWANVVDYEITCGISKRVPRVYKGAP